MAQSFHQHYSYFPPQYFEGGNRNNADEMIAPLSDDCVMWFNAAKYIYRGKADILVHLQEFTKTFEVINFHTFESVVDVENQSIAVRFFVTLKDYDGEEVTMRNCNFFHANEAGEFYEIAIFNSGPLQKGFEAGNSA